MTWGTAVVLLILAVILFFSIRSMVRAKAKGRPLCGGSCAGCSSVGTCPYSEKQKGTGE